MMALQLHRMPGVVRDAKTNFPLGTACTQHAVTRTTTSTSRRISATSSPVSLQDTAIVRVPWLQDANSARSKLQRVNKADSSASALAPILPSSKSLHELSYDADDDYTLPQWAERFIRQVSALPNGRRALLKLLTAMVDLRSRAAVTCGEQSLVVQAYQDLALIDLTAYAWQERLQDLEAELSKDTSNAVYRQQHLEARMALSGCGYMRIHAVSELAKRAHLLLDGQGTSQDLNLSALPAPHTIGINWSQLLQQGLGIDLQNPEILKLTDAQLQQLQHLSFEEYHAKLSDPRVCGEWQYKYFSNEASLVPAPFAKFGTQQLAELLTPDVVLSSLRNGVWGRALVAAASEVGLTIDFTQLAGGEPEVAVQAGAGSVGSASAWLFLQSQLAGSRANLAKVRALAVAVVATAATILQQHQQQQ